MEQKFGCVYFIYGEETGSIKIGFSKDLDKRLYDIQLCCPEELKVLCSVYGTYALEGFLQKKFEHFKKRGSWFSDEPELMDFIFKLSTDKEYQEKLFHLANIEAGIDTDYIKTLEWKYKDWQVKKEIKRLGIPDAFPGNQYSEKDFPKWFLDIKYREEKIL